MCHSSRSIVSFFYLFHEHHRPLFNFFYSANSWLAELGPMFFTLKEQNFSHKDKRRQDREVMSQMEEELRHASEKRQEELRVASAPPPSRTPIVTPGTFKKSTTRASTPFIRKRRGI
jgi:hypothetical protein